MTRSRVFVRIFAATSDHHPNGAVQEVNEDVERFFQDRDIQDYAIVESQVNPMPNTHGSMTYLVKVIVHGNEYYEETQPRSGEL